MTTAQTAQEAQIKMFAWMQLEVPNMTVEEGRKELEDAGNTVLGVGSRYVYEMDVNGQKKVTPAWGANQEEAEKYLETCYPDYCDSAKLLKTELVDRCFKVAQT